MISRHEAEQLAVDVENLERALRILIHRLGGSVTFTEQDYDSAPPFMRSWLSPDQKTLTLSTQTVPPLLNN